MVAVGLGLGLGCAGGWSEVKVMESGPERVAMVELFTSEGCKSCPVAEEWLSRLKEREDLWKKFVPVAWHVDSWDSLGWKDRWSSPRFSQRQWAYAKGWGKDSVEAPAFVLHGREWAKVEEKSLLEVGPSAGRLRVEMMGNRVEVIWTPVAQTSKAQRAFLAPLESGIQSEVTAGENAGRRLSHDFVAREIVGVELKGTDGVWRGGGTVKVRGDALAVWIKREGEVEPLQAVGGWIRP